ncbi:unnamed protein product [Penicillium olsonii]|nr:unnamed protein product [Penicillium olsonii]
MAQQDTIERIDSGCHDTTDGGADDHSRNVEMIKAGTLPTLVENLTRHDRLDAAFNRAFLATYTYFTSGSELLGHLIDRFDNTQPPSTDSTEIEQWSTQTKPLIRLRVVNILRQWLEHFWSEPKGHDTDELLRAMRAFVQRVASEPETPTQQLDIIIQRRLSGQTYTKKSHPSISNPPKPILPRKLDKLQFMKIDAKEIARQLTILEAQTFSNIQREEFLHKNWQKKTTPLVAPNVRCLIRHSNQISNWVCGAVLAEPDLKKRAQVVDHLVNVASTCHQLQNYSAVISILSGLESAPIYRLARTWAMVTERSCNMLRPLQAMIVSAQNYQAYRETLRVAVPPCIPFLGLFLKDLTFIEDGNPALTSDGLINFHKYTMLATTVQEVQRWKEAPYCLQPVPELQEYLAKQLHSAVELHEMWDRSCELEPKGRGLGNRPRDLYTPTGGMSASMVVACMVLDD